MKGVRLQVLKVLTIAPICLMLTSCQTGPNAQRQLVAPSGNRVQGNMQTVSAQRDSIVGDNAVVQSITNNNFYGELSKEQLMAELKLRDEKILKLGEELGALQPTKFKVSAVRENIPDGDKYKTEVDLVPTGKQPVVIFRVFAKTRDSEILSVFIDRSGMSTGGPSLDKKAFQMEFQNIRAAPLKITIHTKAATRLEIAIDPFEG